jgi:hypothetical protein
MFSAAAAQASRTREMGIAMSVVRHNDFFFGWRVVGAAFVLAVLAWGTGFYGPPIYLQALQENRGWPVGRDNPFRCWCSRRGQSADTPRALWYSQCDKGWCSLLAVGVLGWASAAAP